MYTSESQQAPFTVLFLGPSKVGKSKMIQTLLGEQDTTYSPTFEDSNPFYHHPSERTLNLVEMGGTLSETLLNSAISVSDGFVLVYEAGNQESYLSVMRLYNLISKVKKVKLSAVIVIANKFPGTAESHQIKLDGHRVRSISAKNQAEVINCMNMLVDLIEESIDDPATSAHSLPNPNAKKRLSYAKRTFSFRLSVDRIKDVFKHMNENKSKGKSLLEKNREKQLHLTTDTCNASIVRQAINNIIPVEVVEGQPPKESLLSLRDKCFEKLMTDDNISVKSRSGEAHEFLLVSAPKTAPTKAENKFYRSTIAVSSQKESFGYILESLMNDDSTDVAAVEDKRASRAHIKIDEVIEQLNAFQAEMVR
jgi:GTPase SAR1 family protein